MRAILIASSIKFNFQLGLCDNLHNDVFIFSVSRFTLGWRMSYYLHSAHHTHYTFIIILYPSYPCMCPLYTIYVHNIAQSKSQPKRFSLYHSFTSMEQRWLKMVGTRVGMRKQNNYTNIYIQLWSILQIKNWYVMFTWKSDKNSKSELGTEARAAFNSLFMVAPGLVREAGSSMLMLLLVRVSLLSSPPDICLSNWHFHIHKPGVFINILKLTNISYNKFIIK